MEGKQQEPDVSRQRNWGDPPPDYWHADDGVRWYHIRHTKLTVQYICGIITGFGIGIVPIALASNSLYKAVVVPFGVAMLAISIAAAVFVGKKQYTMQSRWIVIYANMLNGEYGYGVLAGIGISLLFSFNVFIRLVGFVLISFGGGLAYHQQRTTH